MTPAPATRHPWRDPRSSRWGDAVRQLGRADVLLRLGAMTGTEDYASRASDLLRTMASTMRAPACRRSLLSAVDFYLGPVKEVALAGDREVELQALLNALYDQFEQISLPSTLTRTRRPGGRLPFLQDRPPREGRATAYVCEHFACCLQCTNLTRCSDSSPREPALAGKISEHARSVSRIAR